MANWMIAEPVRSWFSGETLHAEAVKGSDFWRKTHYGFIRHSGHFYAEPVEGNFTMQVSFTGNYQNEYDQAGLMVLFDETTWIKTGIEFTEGRYFASAVVTRDTSDWAVAPLPAAFSGTLTTRIKREGGSFEIHYRLAEPEPWVLLRLTFLTEAPRVYAGRMVCAPSGEGFAATFNDFLLQTKGK